MESSLKERIVRSLLKQVLLFIAFCVTNKFFYDRADWLFNSAMWCLILAVAHIISKNLITAMNIRNDYWGIAIDFVSIYLVAKLLSIFVPNVF